MSNFVCDYHVTHTFLVWIRKKSCHILEETSYFHESAKQRAQRELFLLQCEVFLCSLVMLHPRLSASYICTIFRLLLVITEMSDTIQLIHFTCAAHPFHCSSA